MIALVGDVDLAESSLNDVRFLVTQVFARERLNATHKIKHRPRVWKRHLISTSEEITL